MAGKRIIYFTTKGKFTSERVWKSLTTKGLQPAIYLPEKPTKKAQSKLDELNELYEFFDVNEDDSRESIIEVEEERLFPIDDWLDEIDKEVDEFIYITGEIET